MAAQILPQIIDAKVEHSPQGAFAFRFPVLIGVLLLPGGCEPAVSAGQSSLARGKTACSACAMLNPHLSAAVLQESAVRRTVVAVIVAISPKYTPLPFDARGV
eukprot:2850082-Rhodomonas_salina.4